MLTQIVLALQSIAFCASPQVPFVNQATPFVQHHKLPHVVMLPRNIGQRDGGFDYDNIDPAAMAKTKRRTAIAWVAIGSIFGAISLSGKSVDQYNAPGYAAAASKREAEKAAYFQAEEARRASLVAKACESAAARGASDKRCIQ